MSCVPSAAQVGRAVSLPDAIIIVIAFCLISDNITSLQKIGKLQHLISQSLLHSNGCKFLRLNILTADEIEQCNEIPICHLFVTFQTSHAMKFTQ